MLRLVVATYLMIVTAAGPAACCCTITRLTERLACPSSAPKAGGCCQGAGGPVQDEGPRHPSPSDDRGAPGCPCKEGGKSEAAALPAAPGEGPEAPAWSALSAFSLLAVPSDQLTPAGCDRPAFRGPPARGPSVGPDQLLYAFHMLRC